jgi:hypothetical protein
LLVDKGFFCALEHDQGIFSAREKKGGALKDGSYFAQNEDGFFFEGIKVGVAKVMQQFGFSACVHIFF